MSRSASVSTTRTISAAVSPNLARSPAEPFQRPTPLALSFARTPSAGRMPVFSAASSAKESSSMRSSTTMTVLSKRWARSAVSMYARSL